MSTMTSERKAELIREVEAELTTVVARVDENRLKRELEILRALPVTDEREHPLVEMTRIDEELGLYDDGAKVPPAPVEGDEAWADAVEEYRIRGNGISRAYALAAVKAIVAKAPDAGLVEARSPLGNDAKLNELILLAIMAAADEQGKGLNLELCRHHADHAARLWDEHLAVKAG